MTNSGDDPFHEGGRARVRGDSPADNPYPENDEWAHIRWLEGWRDMEEHLTNRDEALASIGWFR